MFYNIVFSPTGGTRAVADTLVKSFSENSYFIDLCYPDFLPFDLEAEDTALIAVPSYGGRVPSAAGERISKICAHGTKAVLVCVYGNRAYDDTLAELKDLAEKAGFVPIAAVAAVAEHSMARSVAAGRPDSVDKADLTRMAARIKRKLDSGRTNPVQVPGTVPVKPAANMGALMAPRASRACMSCGACFQECPTRAISMDTLKADRKKCIACMRCVSVCPDGARKINLAIGVFGGVSLNALCRHRKENELFI